MTHPFIQVGLDNKGVRTEHELFSDVDGGLKGHTNVGYRNQ